MIIVNIVLYSLLFYLILSRYCQNLLPLFKMLLGLVLSVTTLSYLFCLTLFFNINHANSEIAALIFSIIFLAYNFKFFQNLKQNFLDKNISISKTQYVIVLVFLIIFSLLFFINSKRWGEWDAIAIWTLHSKFLVSESNFTNLFAEEIAWIHTDYPLMLSSYIAMVWKSLNSTSAMIPLYVAYFNSLIIILLIFSAFLKKHTKHKAIIVLIILCSAVRIDTFGSQQYSDTLLSLFFLIPLLIYNTNTKDNYIPCYILIGFFAASAGWVKNEGLAFFLVFAIHLLIVHIKSLNKIKYFMIGSIMPILIIIYFKLTYAPPNDLVEESSISSLDKLIDIDRYLLVFDYIINMVIYKNPLTFILVTSAIAIDYKYCFSFSFRIISSMLILYFFVYILTPKGLDWHLSTSIDRVFHQLTPLIVYSIFYYYSKKYSFNFNKLNG